MLMNMLANVMILYVSIPLLPILFLAVFYILNAHSFKKGTYAHITGNSYFATLYNRGRYGEYLTYQELKSFEAEGGKFLFNCYLPKNDGTTTKIDVLLIHSTGIFVIESKNYSGWIFGSEKSNTWTQTLRGNNRRVQKKHFYNPIMQNNTHIKWLKKIVGNNIPVYSVIAFSKRCSLKDITVDSPNVKVINRPSIHETVKLLGNRSIQSLSKMDIERIYEILYPYTQTSEYEKLKHIENINTARHTSKKATRTSGSEMNRNAKEPSPNNETTKQQNAAKQEIKQEPQEPGPKSDVPEQIIPQNNPKICVRCGAEMVLRTARKGEHAGEQFYGCSRFPKCRYKETISS